MTSERKIETYECNKCKMKIKADNCPFCCPNCGCMVFGVVREPITQWDKFQMIGRG